MEDITTKQADTIWHQDSLTGTGIVRMGTVIVQPPWDSGRNTAATLS